MRCSSRCGVCRRKIALPPDLDVVGAKPGALELRARVGGEPREVARAGAQLVAHSRQRAMQRGRLLPLGRVEITIARAHREPVGLAQRRPHAQLDRHAQVRDHALHQHELLIVLLPEEQHVGRHDVQQPADDRRDAVEVPRPAGAAQLAAQRRQLHSHCLLERRTDRSPPRPARTAGRRCRPPRSAPRRRRACAGTRAKSSLGPNCVGLTKMLMTTRRAACGAERGEAHVPRVQIAHRRRERDRLAGRAPRRDGGADRADGVTTRPSSHGTLVDARARHLTARSSAPRPG